MLLFHVFTWHWKTEGLIALWATVLLVGLVLFKSRECVKEVISEALDEASQNPTEETPALSKGPQYLPAFAGYNLQG